LKVIIGLKFFETYFYINYSTYSLCQCCYFWRQSEGGINTGWCISGGNHSHSLEKVGCRQKQQH
jgi:hypothetical protein